VITDVLRDFALFVDGDRYVGKIDELKLPQLEVIEEDFRAGGMDAPMPLDMGTNALKAEFTVSGVDRGVLSRFGLELGQRSIVMARGALQDPVTGFVKPVTACMTGNVRKIDPGSWKAGERATLVVGMSLIHYKLTHTIPGLPLIEIDIINGTRIINGIDQLIAIRAAIGR
jgi:P2 family phage contractile tail tube protein